jgi:hypothetical protein
MSGTCGGTSLEGFTECSQQWICCAGRDDLKINGLSSVSMTYYFDYAQQLRNLTFAPLGR